ncbi:haloacid dehalogenase type II [Elioraea rosea]|uniref:haloacid dehalogenase type II n=1 Tax=Elioraea rosea TaxID=2492390 RepID=UPI00195144D6|nr:haloacid dehalogenase type II [Elioraea rosea]
MTTPPRVVVFDAYGTLFDVHAAMAGHARKLGAGWERASALWRQKQLEYSWVCSLTGPEHWRDFEAITRDALLTALNWDGGADGALVEALMDAYRALPPFDEVPEMLQRLRENDIATAILSNGSRAMLDAAVKSARLGHLLNEVLSVDAVRVFKPDPRVYRMAEDAFHCHASEMMFVSSNAWDAQAAWAYGFRTVWVNRINQPTEFALSSVATVMDDLSAIPSLVLGGGPEAT